MYFLRTSLCPYHFQPMISQLFVFILEGIMLLFCAIIIHEIGHITSQWIYTGQQPKLYWRWGNTLTVGTTGEFQGIPPRQQFFILFNGFLAGIAMLFLEFILLGYNIVVFALLIPYIFGSIPDLRGMYYLTRRKQ